MARIISFATQKGGSGKSTLLMLTAAAIKNRTNNKVLVIDSDPQRSVKYVYGQEKDKDSYDVIGFNWKQNKPEVNFQKTIQLAERKYDVILMDVPGRIDGKEMYFSILISDIVIIPIVASALDIQSTMEFLNALPELRAEKKRQGYPLEVYGVINKKDQTIENAKLKELAGIGGLQMFYSPISYLARYKRYLSTSQDIADPADKKDEFNQYFDEFRTKCYI